MKLKNKKIITDTFSLDYEENQLTFDITGNMLTKTISDKSNQIQLGVVFSALHENEYDYAKIISDYNEEQFKTCSFILDAVKVKMNIFGKRISPSQAKDVISVFDSTLHIYNSSTNELKNYWEKNLFKIISPHPIFKIIISITMIFINVLLILNHLLIQYLILKKYGYEKMESFGLSIKIAVSILNILFMM